MRRIPILAASTIAGLAGVIGFHSSRSATLKSLLASQAAAGGRTTPRTHGGRSPSGSSLPSGSTSRASAGSLSATGALEQYGYGRLAVRVTVSSRRITAVSVPDIQVADSYSGSIASQVIPMLRSQVLSAQSARINGVSGATYTSEAYAMSLQSALDKLHFK